ncbi:NADH dehydrogenase [Exophiala aquamarina CBS 119918]|uniref:NADH dehydrogenase n=1 Tax=Exophiala aquamarina CBS 119918 TaxID=1182545 RepID=A0A072PC29_9EURO|nr:NADH dehydrogenase [Exophiala aquamarina CBS 119918]KEF57292.1 NADH dehydrogenase [Exophiala aquamarina CBS 119918]
MPTPESEAFLAKKPKVPPTFQGVDFADNEAVANARDAIIREQWVKSMMTRLVGEEMASSVAALGYGLYMVFRCARAGSARNTAKNLESEQKHGNKTADKIFPQENAMHVKE